MRRQQRPFEGALGEPLDVEEQRQPPLSPKATHLGRADRHSTHAGPSKQTTRDRAEAARGGVGQQVARSRSLAGPWLERPRRGRSARTSGRRRGSTAHSRVISIS